MKRFTSWALTGGMAIASCLTGIAGNIPQYIPSYMLADEFPYLDNRTIVDCGFSQHAVIFADGMEYTFSNHTGEGFPIGFEFTYGGKRFNQFAIDSWGAIYLGDAEEGITYRGWNDLFGFLNPSELDKADEFYLGMVLSDIWPEFKGGDKKNLKPEISYATNGTMGSRVLTVQFLNYCPNGSSGEKQNNGAYYDLQIRLYEADNHIEIAFNEEYSPTKNYKFTLGLRGYEREDSMLMTAGTLSQAPVVSEFYYSNWDMKGCFVTWNGEDDYDNYYKPVYSFRPATNPVAPLSAPTDLTATEREKDILVTCKRADDADATVVLYSEQPFEPGDFPADGATFRSHGKFGEVVTSIGNAKVLYYGNAKEISVAIPEVKLSKDYYVAALSANGYPAFNRENVATAEVSTTQAPPATFECEPAGNASIKFSWTAADEVIIASTDICSYLGDVWYEGIFGRPTAGVKAGDPIEGGGTVVYKGTGSEYIWENAPENGMLYFAAWTVKDGVVSSRNVLSHAATDPALPYEPRLEYYPTAIVPEEIEANTNDGSNLGAYTRDYTGDRAVRLRLVAGNPIEFYLPEVDINIDDAVLLFDFALETDRGLDTSGKVQVPLGYGVGHFDSGALEVKVSSGGNSQILKTIKEYDGEMVSNGDNGYFSGSSTYERVSVPLSAFRGNAKIGFRAAADEFSYLFIKNIGIYSASGISAATVGDGSLSVLGGKGTLTLATSKGGIFEVYSIDGRKAGECSLGAGESVTMTLASGLYIVGENKVIVK